MRHKAKIMFTAFKIYIHLLLLLLEKKINNGIIVGTKKFNFDPSYIHYVNKINKIRSQFVTVTRVRDLNYSRGMAVVGGSVHLRHDSRFKQYD